MVKEVVHPKIKLFFFYSPSCFYKPLWLTGMCGKNNIGSNWLPVYSQNIETFLISSVFHSYNFRKIGGLWAGKWKLDGLIHWCGSCGKKSKLTDSDSFLLRMGVYVSMTSWLPLMVNRSWGSPTMKPWRPCGDPCPWKGTWEEWSSWWCSVL